jgi:hypothetical protein
VIRHRHPHYALFEYALAAPSNERFTVRMLVSRSNSVSMWCSQISKSAFAAVMLWSACAGVTSIPESLRVEIPLQPARVLRPVRQFVESSCVIAFLVFEGLEQRELNSSPQ